MGAAMRAVLIWAVLLAGCPVEAPCGWDDQLTPGGEYGLGFVEVYEPDATTARYRTSLDFIITDVDSVPPCPDIDETGVGQTFVLRLPPEPPRDSCSEWYPTIVEPEIAVEFRAANTVFNWHGYNMMIVDGLRDLGGGCHGVWELTVHAPENDPFAPQSPLAPPVVLAYRYFTAATDAVDACYAVLGLDAATYDYPRCGDAYVAAMDRR
jgi:hypothetical protein